MSFVIYRVILGALVLGLIATNRLDPNAGAEAPTHAHAPATDQ